MTTYFSAVAFVLVLAIQPAIAAQLKVLPVAKRRGSWRSTSALILLELRGGSDNNAADYPYGKDEPYRESRDQKSYQDDNAYNSYSSRRDFGGQYDSGESYYNDDRYYERDYDDRSYRNPENRASPSIPNLSNIIRNGDRRIGLTLLASGTAFTMLGISLFFNKSLMRLGNLLFIGGVPMTIGPGRTAGYFFQPKKSRATGCLALGIFLVFIGSPVFGIILEVFGLLNLFGNMFPVVAAVMKQMPVVGTIFGGRGGGSRGRERNDLRGEDDDDNGYGRDRYDRDDYRSGDGYENDDRYYGRGYDDGQAGPGSEGYY